MTFARVKGENTATQVGKMMMDDNAADDNQLYLKICNSFDHVTDFFRELRNDDAHTNVVLRSSDCQGSSGAVVHAHKEVLAAASPYLAELMDTSCDDCHVHISFADYTFVFFSGFRFSLSCGRNLTAVCFPPQVQPAETLGRLHIHWGDTGIEVGHGRV